VPGKSSDFLKTPGIDEPGHPLAGREFSGGMLLFDPLLAAAPLDLLPLGTQLGDHVFDIRLGFGRDRMKLGNGIHGHGNVLFGSRASAE
jgi:hypothetical protein